MPEAVYLRDLPPARLLRTIAAVLAVLAGAVSLASGAFALNMVLSGEAARETIANTGAIAYTILVAAGFFAAAFGLAKARAWSWMLLAGLALMQGMTYLSTIAMLSRFYDRPFWVLFLAVLPIVYSGAVLALALHPAIRRACAPPPAAW